MNHADANLAGSWAARLLRERPRQPDARSCGASVLVVERALRDDAYAQLLVTGVHPVTGWARPGPLADRFRDEVLAMHRRTTGPITPSGRAQLPWPRALGTPPWAVAWQVSTPGRRYVVRWARSPGPLLELITRRVASGTAVPLYVVSRRLPRHVVLVTDADAGGLCCYEPHSGDVRRVRREAFLDGTLSVAGWPRPWCAVVPSAASPRQEERRSPA